MHIMYEIVACELSYFMKAFGMLISYILSFVLTIDLLSVHYLTKCSLITLSFIFWYILDLWYLLIYISIAIVTSIYLVEAYFRT